MLYRNIPENFHPFEVNVQPAKRVVVWCNSNAYGTTMCWHDLSNILYLEQGN